MVFLGLGGLSPPRSSVVSALHPPYMHVTGGTDRHVTVELRVSTVAHRATGERTGERRGPSRLASRGDSVDRLYKLIMRSKYKETDFNFSHKVEAACCYTQVDKINLTYIWCFATEAATFMSLANQLLNTRQ